MYKKEFKTHFVGQTRLELTSCPSTNDFMKELLQHGLMSNGQLVTTSDQTDGRGQLSNSWESQSSKNLTFSVGFLDLDFPIENQFQLNIIAALAVAKTINENFNLNAVVKWPNDVLVKGKKIAGILIETSISKGLIYSAVVGIGLNVNQQDFISPGATSISKELKEVIELDLVLNRACENLEHFIFRKEDLEGLRALYCQNLYQMGVSSFYEDHCGRFEGIIDGVSELGELRVMRDGILQYYEPKQIKFLR